MVPSRPPRRSLSTRVFGYDVFVSFALGPLPRGSRAYASDLARRLRERDFMVFFSEDEAPVGGELDDTLRRALRRSNTLVVVANRGTLADPRWVRIEVDEFRRHHPRRPVVPISIDGALLDPQLAEAAEPWLRFRDRIWVDETREAGESGIVSDDVIERLATAPTSVRAAVRWRALVGGVVVFFAGLATVATWMGVRADRSAKAEAKAAVEARAAEGRASAAALREGEAASAARASERRASEAAVKEAEAASAARNAEAEARKQRDEALRQRDMALARQIAVLAERTPSSRMAVLLAAESLHLRPFAETEALLRAKLALLPRVAHHWPLRGLKPVADMVVWSFSPSGKLFVAGARAGPLQVIDVETGRMLLRVDEAQERAEFSADETLLALANGSRQAQLVRLADGTRRKIVDGEGDVASFAFSADGRRLLVGLRTNYPGMGAQRNGHLVFDTISGRRLAEGRVSREVHRVAFSTDGEVAYVEAAGELTAWRAANGFAKSEKLTSSVRQWATDSQAPGVLVLDMEGRLRRIEAADPTDGAWDGDRVDSFAVSADGERFATADSRGVTVIDRRRDFVRRFEVASVPVVSIAFVDQSRMLRVDRTLYQLEPSPPAPMVRSENLSTAWHPRGTLLATPESPTDDLRVQFWQTRGGDDLVRLRHEGKVCCLRFSRDGRRLLSAGSDGTARLWDWASGRELVRASHGYPMHAAWFAPDETSVVSLGSGGAQWWRAADAKRLGGFERELQPAAVSLAWRRGEPRLAIAESLERVAVMDVRNGTLLARREHPGGVEPAQPWHRLTVLLGPEARELVTLNRQSPVPLLLHDLDEGRTVPLRLEPPGFPASDLAITDRQELVAWGRVLADDPVSMRVWVLPAGRAASQPVGSAAVFTVDPRRASRGFEDGVLNTNR